MIINLFSQQIYIVLSMTTAVIDNNKMNKLGLRRKLTYSEIIGMIDDNDKITGKLPNRDASMFRNSPEGSYFDGVDALEQLREEQGRLLLKQMSELMLRQNARTAGKTFHAERTRRLPLQSPVISQPSQPMNVEEETPAQVTNPTPTAPTSSTAQASQLNAELSDRGNKAMKRKEETAMNHRGEVFKQSKPTIAQQIHQINPPRSFVPINGMPQQFNIATDDEAPRPPPPRRFLSGREQQKLRKQAKRKEEEGGIPILPVVEVMDESLTNKRATPEIEGRGGRPRIKKQKPDTTRWAVSKRDKESSTDEPQDRKKRNKKKTDLALEGGGGAPPASSSSSRPRGAGTQGVPPTPQPKATPQPRQPPPPQPRNDDADDEGDEPRGGRGVRRTIQKPVPPSRIGIQKLREEFMNAKNKNMINQQQFSEWETLFNSYIRARRAGNNDEKERILNDMKTLYRGNLFDKLKRAYREQQ